MAILKVSYQELSLATRNAKNAANDFDTYASKMETGVAKKIISITGGESSRTSEALAVTQQKIKELRAKSIKLSNYASEIEKFEKKLKDTDETVAKKIESLSATFAKEKGFKINKVSAFFENLAVGTFNSTALGRWVKDVYNKAENTVSEWKSAIKDWWRTGEGKYVVDIMLSAIAAGVAITAIFAAGGVILTTMAIIGAIIAVANTVTNIKYSYEAINTNNDDPAKAARYGKMDKYSDYLRCKGNDKLANILDITEDVTTIFTSVAAIGKLGTKLTTAIRSNGFVSLRQLFGSAHNGSVGKLGSKFVVREGGKIQANSKSLCNGLKSVFTDSNFKRSIGQSGRLFKDEMTDIYKYTRANVKQGGYVFKDLLKGNTTQKLRAKEIIFHFIKTDVKDGFNTINNIRKDVNSLKNNIKKIYKSSCDIKTKGFDPALN